MHRDVSLEKIGYMMNRLGGDDELNADDVEEMIIKVFVSSFEYEHGFEAELITALLTARRDLLAHETDDDHDPVELSAEEAEKWYYACQSKMYMQAGYSKEYADESTSWPEALPLRAAWDKKILGDLARKEVAHHLVVLDQIRAEMAKKNDNANS